MKNTAKNAPPKSPRFIPLISSIVQQSWRFWTVRISQEKNIYLFFINIPWKKSLRKPHAIAMIQFIWSLLSIDSLMEVSNMIGIHHCPKYPIVIPVIAHDYPAVNVYIEHPRGVASGPEVTRPLTRPFPHQPFTLEYPLSTIIHQFHMVPLHPTHNHE